MATKKGLARDYGVGPRAIDFLLNPDKLEQNKKLRQERGGTKIYYNKEKHKESMKKTRRYKQELECLLPLESDMLSMPTTESTAVIVK